MENTSNLKKILYEIIIATLYVVLTLVIHPIGGTFVQIRISEALMILILFNKRHTIGLTLGCFIANLFSEFLIFDITIGTLATFISCLWIIYLKDKYFICLLYPVVINGVAVGLMLNYVFQMDLLISILSVALSEFFTLYLVGIPIFYIIKSNKILAEQLS